MPKPLNMISGNTNPMTPLTIPATRAMELARIINEKSGNKIKVFK